MASVQELLLALDAQKSPFVSLLEGLATGANKAYNDAPQRQLQEFQLQQAKAEEERAREQDKQVRALLARGAEEGTQTAFRGVSPGGNPVLPQSKLSMGVEYGKKGYLRPTFDVVKPKEPDQFYTKDQVSAIQSGDPAALDAAFAGKVPRSAVGFYQSAQRTTEKRASSSSQLRKEFIGLPEVKDFVEVNTSVKSMDALLGSALSGDKKNQLALDQGLITMYNKMIDPSSVVRESEYARTAENLPFVNRISGAISKVQQGGAGLTNEDREALVLGAKIIANERGKVFSERRSEYSRLAGDMKFDPKSITGTIQDFKEFDLSPVNSRNDAPAVGGVKIIGVRKR